MMMPRRLQRRLKKRKENRRNKKYIFMGLVFRAHLQRCCGNLSISIKFRVQKVSNKFLLFFPRKYKQDFCAQMSRLAHGEYSHTERYIYSLAVSRANERF